MNLLKSLVSALDGSKSASGEREPLNPEMAAAVLLIAMERADFDSTEDERAEIKHLLATHFQLPEGELESLLVKAEQEVGESVSFYHYVEHLNSELEYDDKCRVLTMLWKVAYADGELDPFEEQLMRRMADMLYLSHSDYVRTKLQVTGQA